MAQLRQDYAQFTARDADLLVVSPEGRDEVRAYWEREQLPFPGLADPDQQVADSYGQQVSLMKLGRVPELVIIDRAGMIRYAHQASWMSDIPTNKMLFDVLDQLNRAVGQSPAVEKARETTL
jgi:peroxiredoxin